MRLFAYVAQSFKVYIEIIEMSYKFLMHQVFFFKRDTSDERLYEINKTKKQHQYLTVIELMTYSTFIQNEWNR